jgi:sugar O-acyltransferase (sialic acid O-acetyltransferase NeuD family)
MKDLIILGAGGTAFDLIDIANAMNKINKQWNILGLLDDNVELIGKKVYNYPVLGTIPQSENFKDAYFVSSIGDAYRTKLRMIVRKKVPFSNERFASLIHPTAIISESAIIEPGAVIYGNVTLSGKVHIGHDVFLCGNTFLGHESVIGNHSLLSVGNYLASDVQVGNCCYLGVGVMVRHQITIGENCLIGMGTKIVKSIPPNSKLINKLENIMTDNI